MDDEKELDLLFAVLIINGMCNDGKDLNFLQDNAEQIFETAETFTNLFVSRTNGTKH
jgi:hypothetical protein|tara:strand:+ start:775 stop:945 length:171 start_codon:yes stop_codon:yes gene_type:complete